MSTADPRPYLRPWHPEALSGHPVLATVARYVVVEEIALDEVRCVVSEWPYVDDEGRLVFDDPENAREYVDPRFTIERLLSERRIVPVGEPLDQDSDAELREQLEQELRERSVEVGDVYAILSPDPFGPGGGGSGPRGGLFAALEDLRDVPIYDLTVEARGAAAATYSVAVAGALSEKDALRFLDDEDDSQDKTGGAPTPTDPGSTPRGPGSAMPAESLETVVEAVAREPEPPRRQASASAGA